MSRAVLDRSAGKSQQEKKKGQFRLEQLAIEFKMAETEPLRSIAPKPTQATTLMNAAPSAPGKGQA